MRIVRPLSVPATALLLPALLLAQDPPTGEVTTVPVADGVFMLMGAGGNIALSVGEDGAFLVDDQYAPVTEHVKTAVRAQTEKPIRFVVNTHWHGDHTGGNEQLGSAGAIIVAHENVRKRMSSDQFIAALGDTVRASPAAALPVVTFADAVTFHWNGDEIRVVHVDPAHTDGDAFIHFTRANVIHAGDTYFNGMYPFIDGSSGGSLVGMIAATDRLLAMSNAGTKFIPGHGELSGRAEVEAYRKMLVLSQERIGKLVAEGKSREAVIAARPLREFDATWGAGFINAETWAGLAYDEMKARAAAPAPTR